MRIAIAIDRWKLPIFERHLSFYNIEQGDGVTDDTMFLYIETENALALARKVHDANTEAKKSRDAK